MTVRFLTVTASSVPYAPFMPGQVIHLTGMTPELKTWLKEGRAELLPEEPEAATVAPSERAVMPRAKGRHAEQRTAV